ncbi:MAG: glycerophosphodiester phosphodiesterase family protein [Ruminiclostridium sp.]|nr:glycerophosphodiester phosphodiesterase family protein [Ruminiclostridium sp.]
MFRYPLITAHSGCENTCPDTLDSMMFGIHSGADIIEADVRSTEDEVVILSHNDYIEVPCYGKFYFSDHKYEEIKVRYPQIVRLEDIFEMIRSSNKMLNLDLKDDAVTIPALEIVKVRNMLDYVIFTGCECEKASYITQRHKGTRVLLNSQDDMIKHSDVNYKDFMHKTYKDAVGSACCGINISFDACFDDFIDFMTVRFMPVSVYTIDDAETMKKYINMGAYSITTNCVRMLSSIVRS